jgi:hypothetical protein
MKKKLYLVGGGLLAVFVIGYLCLAFFMGSVVRTGVNRFGPRLTKTKVELSGAAISPLTGSGTLRGLFVGNPAGWSSDRAFYLGQVGVKVQPMSIFGDHIVIDEITIDQPEFVYETRFVSSNIKELLKNIEDFTGSGAQAAQTKSGQPIKFVVKKFRLTNGKATVGVGPAALPIPFPDIALDDLGVKEGGISPDQLAAAVMKNVLGNIVTGSAKALGQVGTTAGAAGLEKTKEAAKKAADGIKSLFGGSKP